MPAREGLRGWVFHSDYSSNALILRSFQLGRDVALPVITSLSIFLRHQPLAQLSFQCWGQKMPSPDEFSRHRLWYSYLESRLPFTSCVWDSCKDEKVAAEEASCLQSFSYYRDPDLDKRKPGYYNPLLFSWGTRAGPAV